MKIFIFICIALCSFHAKGQEKKLPWDYPVKPGSIEWQNKTYQEKIDACQIPVDVLSSLSTEDLAEVCLKYPPLMVHLMSSNSYERGLDVLHAQFNGVRELFKRRDAAKALLKQYQEMIQKINLLSGMASDDEKGDFVLDVAAVELLLSRFLAQYNADKKNDVEILQHLMKGYEKKLLYPDFFGGLSFGVNFFARAIAIKRIDIQSLEKFSQKENNKVFSLGVCDEMTMQTINDLSYQYIK
jgi:hypothetical protein